MRVLALVPYLFDTSPGQRFRIEQWEPFLREYGVEIEYHAFEDPELHDVLYRPGAFGRKIRLIAGAVGRRTRTVSVLRSYDLVYIFREAALLGPPVFERWAQLARVPIVFDFDDAIFVPYKSPSNGYLSLLKFPSKTRTICGMSAHVMAGNPYLAEYARAVNDRVTVVPTTIDTDKYAPVAERSTDDRIVIGWSGSYSTVQHLDHLRSALQRLARTERFTLRVIGTPSYELEGVEVEAMPWRAASEVEDLSQIDVGVMPLPDDPWSRGKCGLKALQYMALGIPTVCSPVGVNSEIVEDGINGFLAATEADWVARLAELLRSAELRKRLGAAGRATVKARYSAKSQAPRVYGIFESVCRSRPGAVSSAHPDRPSALRGD